MICLACQLPEGTWRAWTPQRPWIFADGTTSAEAEATALEKYYQEADISLTRQPEAPVSDQEAAAMAGMGIAPGEVVRGTEWDGLLINLREMVRGEPLSIHLPRLGEGGVFHKWTRYSPEQFEGLAKCHGEIPAVLHAFRHTMNVLGIQARHGSAEAIRVLNELGGLAALRLEDAWREQPEKVRKIAEGASSWPIFFSPFQSATRLENLPARFKDLEVGKLWPIKSSNAGAGWLCDLLFAAIWKAKETCRRPGGEGLHGADPWIAAAGVLPDLQSGGDKVIAAAWFKVAWGALMWAYGNAPETNPKFAEIIRKSEYRNGTMPRPGGPLAHLRNGLRAQCMSSHDVTKK